MRVKRFVTLMAVLGVALTPATTKANGKNKEGGSAQGDAVNASAEVQNLIGGDRPANWTNPCTEDNSKLDPSPWVHMDVDPFTLEAVTKSIKFKSGQEFFTGRWVQWEGMMLRAGLTYQRCVWTNPTKYDPDAGLQAQVPIPAGPPWNGKPEYVGAHWYPIPPSPYFLLITLFKMVEKQVTDPVLSWPNMNPDLGSVYVKVPMAYTLEPVGYKEAHASVQNELGSASATVRATPTKIDVTGPGGSSSCLVGDAMTDHGDDENPPCFLMFDEVSEGAPISVTLTWTITSDVPGADLPPTLTTTSEFTLPVGEIQALVTG